MSREKDSRDAAAGRVWVSLLRGVNVGGKNRLHMAELKAAHEDLGLTDVETYLQSGNAVFRGPDMDPWALARRLEAAVTARTGLHVKVMLRAGEEVQRIVAGNPFPPDRPRARQERRERPEQGDGRGRGSGADRHPPKLHVTFLYAVPAPAKVNALHTPEGRGDAFRVADREIYVWCPGGYGRTKLTNDWFERALRVQGTTRNWNTVTALADRAREMQAGA